MHGMKSVIVTIATTACSALSWPCAWSTKSPAAPKSRRRKPMRKAALAAGREAEPARHERAHPVDDRRQRTRLVEHEEERRAREKERDDLAEIPLEAHQASW